MTCDQATFMLERRWDKTLTGEEERALDSHIQGCAVCRTEAEAIAFADATFLQLPECKPPIDIAAAVSKRIAGEAPAEPRRALFWGAVFAIAAVAAAIWQFGIPIPAAVFASPYYASAHSIFATASEAVVQWLRPMISIARSLSPAAPAILPVLGVAAAAETVVLGRWLVRRTPQGQLPGRV
ncbi:MAG TPA: zf-HC2 domain-containing protein [Armatimonadota bacterium]